MLDPQDDGLSDVPDYDFEDEAFPPLPPPYSPGQGGGQEQGEHFGGAEQGDLSKLADIPAVKPKGVKRPQPRLDSERLTSQRGLPALRTLFDNIRFKGKGHEAEDLQLLMQKMENWAHRLFPKLQFEDFIEKVEKLGSKKEVQTCLKRIRLDMPLTHEDFQDKDAEAQPPAELQAFEDFDPFSSESAINVHSTPAPPALATPSLTEEQLNQIQLNRQRAMERRLARQHQMANALHVSTEQGEKPEDLDMSSTHLPLCPAT
ncbi:TIMELESS-interacting protein, partial [Nematolebias whitei]|uniref:TIMELESS-interacting protein n=1 Tax=Nematolebias whitei TaxID=451745 RepID=UPI001897C10A